MKLQQFTIELGAERNVNTGLKATALTQILGVNNKSGILLGIYVTDPDDLTQNERLQITIDGMVIFNDAAWDIPNTDYWMSLVASITKGSAVGGTGVPTDPGQIGCQIGIPFSNSLMIEYSRAVAGTTGLTINILVALRADVLHP